MNNDELTLLINSLRARYAPSVPLCRICGEKLTVQEIGGGRSTVWACIGFESDPENPNGPRVSKEGRWERSAGGYASEYRPGGHYFESKLVRTSTSDMDVIRLLDEFEAVLAKSDKPAPGI